MPFFKNYPYKRISSCLLPAKTHGKCKRRAYSKCKYIKPQLKNPLDFNANQADGGTGQISYSGTLATVPEPLTILGGGLALGLGFLVKRKIK